MWQNTVEKSVFKERNRSGRDQRNDDIAGLQMRSIGEHLALSNKDARAHYTCGLNMFLVLLSHLVAERCSFPQTTLSSKVLFLGNRITFVQAFVTRTGHSWGAVFERELNLFRIDLAVFTLVPIVSAGLLVASNGRFHINALFVCVIIVLMSLVGSPMFVSLVTVYPRKRYLTKQLDLAIKSEFERTRTRDSGRLTMSLRAPARQKVNSRIVHNNMAPSPPFDPSRRYRMYASLKFANPGKPHLFQPDSVSRLLPQFRCFLMMTTKSTTPSQCCFWTVSGFSISSAKVDPVKAVRDRLPTVADRSLTALTGSTLADVARSWAITLAYQRAVIRLVFRFSAFQVVGAWANTGFSLIYLQLVRPFQTAYPLLIFMGLAVAGNTGFVAYLLDQSLLTESKTFHVGFFDALLFTLEPTDRYPCLQTVYPQVNAEKAASVQLAGFQSIAISALAPVLQQVSLLHRAESSLIIALVNQSIPDLHEICGDSLLRYFSFASPRHRAQLGNLENAFWFTTFVVFFEVVSAYGTVGLSLDVPSVFQSFLSHPFSTCSFLVPETHTHTQKKNCSLSGAMITLLSKLIVCAVMPVLYGRHCGLPVAFDRAIVLPTEFVQNLKASEIVREMKMAKHQAHAAAAGGRRENSHSVNEGECIGEVTMLRQAHDATIASL
ncbi:hypothetical protein EDB92DRAFT_1819936 [Lactarius akahatsu]|uniref:Uncharacterized protein n=1 Tax=Lactarius akahatsu TaxID=416441 RepID=A0AAD4L948_9AGAM|nr:hypothetical protein EDB92DRAFT_1819936 [Lactarius akahatsu]